MKFSFLQQEHVQVEEQWVTVSGSTAFVFRVKACQNVQVILATVLGNSQYGASKIVIGEDNLKSYFYPNVQGHNPLIVDTPNILNCNEFQAFFIQWTLNGVHVGYGAFLGGHTFIEFHVVTGQLELIQAIAMLNFHLNSVEFEIMNFIGKLHVI